VVHATSDRGLNLIRHYEGFSSKPYLCAGGRWTIGYGHVILPDETFTEITEDEAIVLLSRDVMEAEGAVDILVKVPLNQNQFDALVSFVYNLGSGNLKSSTLLKLLNASDYDGAAKQFDRWVYAGGRQLLGLIARRKAEEDLFNEVPRGGEKE